MYDFKLIEKEMLAHWKKIKLLEKLEKKNKNGTPYFLLDGPPYANNMPHVGHIRNTVYKDLNLRIAFMKGQNVLFQPGFDTHGLPVENMVEKNFKMHSKKDIQKLGVKKFCEECKKWAATYKDLWMEVYDKLGSWYSWKEPYLTYDNSYVESGWWTFKQLWDKNLVYEGQRPVFWCPSCETALAGYEVTDSYTQLKDPCIFIKFKLKGKEEYLVVFTTTPWTLIANVAIAVNPDEEYVKIETAKGVLILAEKRLQLLVGLEIGYKILERFKGKAMDGWAYEPLIDVPQQKELQKNPNALKVYLSIPILKERIPSKLAVKKEGVESGDIFEDFVNVNEGTGLVHTAPGHGKTDNEIGKHYNLPDPSPLDDSCKYTALAGQFEGIFVKDADAKIIELLEEQGKLLHSETVEHKYPVCWRCKKPLIFRMSKQWFLKVDPIRKKMLAGNQNVTWLPEYAGERFAAWVANADDWNVSRQRYWGIPMPIWKCKCGEIRVIESMKELQASATNKIPKDFDLHTAADIKIKCKCKKEMEKINDIFDVWFDSGIAPWASLGYPFANKKEFEGHFPVSRINESQDQIRGWFYSLMFCGIATFDKVPYKEVSMPGWVLDEKGEKMSKSLGNVVWAKEGMEEMGADNLRFYYMWDIAPYDTQKFKADNVKKEVYKIFNILLNINTYLLNQAEKINEVKVKEVEDKWLLSKLNSFVKVYTGALDNFEYHIAGRAFEDFVINKMSRGYIQLIRERVDEKDGAVFFVLEKCLKTTLALLAPVAPFIADKTFLELKEKFKYKEDSVHLLEWPSADKKIIDLELEKAFDIFNDILQKGLAAREELKMGIRWPLKSAKISVPEVGDILKFEELIKKQLNVKNVSIIKGEVFVEYDTKADEELEREGFAREVMRRVQMMRKSEKLKSEEEIKLSLASEYDLSKWKKEIAKKVGASEIFFEDKGYDKKIIETIKGKTFVIGFVK